MGEETLYKSKITVYIVICWFSAAMGGLMFGYDIGISGGVSGMDDFLIKFFPKVHERKLHANENNYCKYDDQLLQLFTSSLYLAALVASFFASRACSVLGRKPTIFMASVLFIAGAGLSAGADHKWMLICGRILFGCGVGFGNEAVPLFLTEIAPVKHRGSVNILFQLFVTIGIFIANLVNYATSKIHPNGWRISLGLAAVPAFFLLIGSFIIMETPASLVEHKKIEKAKETLKRIRGVDNVDAEFEEILHGCEIAEKVEKPFRSLFKKPGVPPLTISILLQVFQQLTGINAIMFYAPVLFQTLGFKTDASLLSSVVTGLVNVLFTCVAIYLVDKVGRRVLLLEACVQMGISQFVIGVILKVYLKPTGTLNKNLAGVVVFFVCFYVMAFSWSWGPMGWLIPSEIFPLETRTGGFAFAVSANMIMTFLIAQVFLSMLCHMQAYLFFFFTLCIIVMGVFVIFFLPETKGVPIDSVVERVWNRHPVWKKFFKDDDVHKVAEMMP